MSESLVTEEFVIVLDRLNILLTNLPSQLPLVDDYYGSQYSSFLSFSLDPDILEKTGDEVATLGEQLESVFGWKARTSGDGVIPILERGKAICALHGILWLYYNKYPANNVLKKWVNDITAGAEKVYEMYGVPIPEFSKEPTLVDMIQIGQWYGKHHNVDYVPSKYRPVVKFRNIEESVLRAVQTGSADDESVLDVGATDSDNEDEAEDELLESEIDKHQPAQDVAFEIHPDIDINSKALKDMISTDPVSVVSVDLSFVLSPQAATMVTDDGDADWNY